MPEDQAGKWQVSKKRNEEEANEYLKDVKSTDVRHRKGRRKRYANPKRAEKHKKSMSGCKNHERCGEKYK